MDEILGSTNILPEEKRVLMAEWALIARDHDLLVQGQERIISKWWSLEIEEKFDRFIEDYWAIADNYSRWQEQFAKYQSYCSRQVPPAEYDAAVKECAGIKSRIDRDLQALQAESEANAAFYNSEVRAAVISINGDIEEQNQKYGAWLSRIQGFNKKAEGRLRPRGKSSHIFIHVQPDGMQGRASWLAGSTLRNPTRQAAASLLAAVQAQTAVVLGNRVGNLKGFEAAAAAQAQRLATYSQPNGRQPWSVPFGDRLQFRLDLEVVGEYPFIRGSDE